MPRKAPDDGLTAQQRHHKKHRERRLARKRELRNTDEFRAKARAYAKEWRARNKTEICEKRRARYQLIKARIIAAGRKRSLRLNYNLTLEDFDALLEAQSGKCWICGVEHKEQSQKRLHVDHCHKSGKVRGLLCMSCNTKLGWVERYFVLIMRYLTRG